MTKRDIENRISVLFKQLQVMNLLKKDFLEKLGTRGYAEKTDDILDEINYWRSVLKKRAEQKNNNDESRK